MGLTKLFVLPRDLQGKAKYDCGAQTCPSNTFRTTTWSQTLWVTDSNVKLQRADLRGPQPAKPKGKAVGVTAGGKGPRNPNYGDAQMPGLGYFSHPSNFFEDFPPSTVAFSYFHDIS